MDEYPELCRARHAGEFVSYDESAIPMSKVLECSSGNFEFVPAWGNPALSVSITAAAGFGVAALIAQQRHQ